jgi:nitrogenase molybdenum-iron protein alpha/beta subunit
VNVSANPLDCDFLDGYGLALEKIAEDMVLKKGAGERKKIALVGHLMDRTEGDHAGNLLELARLLSLLGIELVCAWPDGREYLGLKKIEKASVIVSLPYARKAAAILARKTGAALLPLGIPLGLGGSAVWLRDAAEACGVSGKTASAVLGRELAEAHCLARMAVGGGLAGKKIWFTGDPYLGEAVCAFACELGMGVAGVCLSCAGGKWGEAEKIFPGRPILRDFRVREYSNAVQNLFSRGDCDLLISNSIGRRSGLLKLAGLDFGFPSYRYHALLSAPFLGFKGAVNLIERWFNAARSV